MPNRLITDTEDLQAFCETCRGLPYVTVDTEFLREKTYYAQLCLIQVGVPGRDGHPPFEVGIDALSPDLNLSPLEEIFFDPTLIKVFHAARQDLEIMVRLFDGRVPAPLFDTQIAAMVTGYGDQIGYATLVKRICGGEIDKSNQYTDWARRPLSKDQIDYALADVSYLRSIYEHLCNILDTTQRWDWMQEDMDALHAPETHITNPRDVWQRIKIRTDRPKNLAILQALAAWREQEAILKDRPRNFILRDDLLAELAKQAPVKDKDLQKIRGLPEKYQSGAGAQHLLSLVHAALETPKTSWPQRVQKEEFPSESIPALEMLKMLLKIQAAEHDVVPRLIAAPEDLETLITDAENCPKLTTGWRHNIFGKAALEMLRGNLALRLESGHITQLWL